MSRGLEFLGSLAGGLVHEIKNPLSTLRINLTLLKEDLEAALPEERALRRRMEVCENEVRRLDAILADFMRYAGMRKLDVKPHDLAELTGQLAEFCRPGMQRDGVALDVEVPSITVRVDAALFKQALLNLLLNAQQAISGGGHVRITARIENGTAVVEIQDDGCGVAAVDKERVFDVYYSASKEGSGLGLPTARRIVEEHGGSLTLESQEGAGTTVRVTLPRA